MAGARESASSLMSGIESYRQGEDTNRLGLMYWEMEDMVIRRMV